MSSYNGCSRVSLLGVMTLFATLLQHVAAADSKPNHRDLQTTLPYTPTNPSPVNRTIVTTFNPNDTARILGLRWINTDTNEVVALSPSTSSTGTSGRPWISSGVPSVWLPERFTAPNRYLDYDIPNTMRLSVEAVTQGPIQSVIFDDDYPGSKTFRNVENTAIWTLCGNRGPDVFACPFNFWERGGEYLNAKAYAGKSGTGALLSTFTSQISIQSTTPSLGLYRHTPLLGARPDLDNLLPVAVNGSNINVFNYTAMGTSNLTFYHKFSFDPTRWSVAAVEFNYDNGTMVRTIERPILTSPGPTPDFYFFMFGANCPPTYGWWDIPSCTHIQYVTPTVGRHTLTLSLFRQAGRTFPLPPPVVGAKRTIIFDVVV